jgi:hypothetical protein
MSLRWKKLNLIKKFWIKIKEDLGLKKTPYGRYW